MGEYKDLTEHERWLENAKQADMVITALKEIAVAATAVAKHLTDPTPAPVTPTPTAPVPVPDASELTTIESTLSYFGLVPRYSKNPNHEKALTIWAGMIWENARDDYDYFVSEHLETIPRLEESHTVKHTRAVFDQMADKRSPIDGRARFYIIALLAKAVRELQPPVEMKDPT